MAETVLEKKDDSFFLIWIGFISAVFMSFSMFFSPFNSKYSENETISWSNFVCFDQGAKVAPWIGKFI